MTYPLISIITPCYNQGQFLKDTVDSVINQSYPNWEMIIIDDGSTDDTAVIALECQKQDYRISLISQTNQGVSAARNNGVKASKGKYILPLDGDDTIEKDYVATAVEYLEKHPECLVFYCLANKFGNENGAWDVMYSNYESLLIGNSIFCSSIFRRTDFDRIGGYDETFILGYEDWEFYIRLLANGGKVYQDKARMFNYRIKESLLSRDSMSHKYEEKICNDIYKKHFEIYTKTFKSFITSQRVLKQYEGSLMELRKKLDSLYEVLCSKNNEIDHLCGLLSSKDNEMQAKLAVIASYESKIDIQNSFIQGLNVDKERFAKKYKKYKSITTYLVVTIIIYTVIYVFLMCL